MKTNYKSWKEVPDGVKYRLLKNVLAFIGVTALYAKLGLIALINAGIVVM